MEEQMMMNGRRGMSGKNPINWAGACKKKKSAELGYLAQKLLRLGYRLAGANLDFGEAPEEDPQGPKLVNKRFSSGCARFVCVTGDCIRSCWPWGPPPMTGGTMT
jgi:hypothetical protein